MGYWSFGRVGSFCLINRCGVFVYMIKLECPCTEIRVSVCGNNEIKTGDFQTVFFAICCKGVLYCSVNGQIRL
jgi:hypothetical protein